MSALTIRLPESLHRHLKEAAESDGVSVNQFISLAVAEKLSALQTYDLIARRAERGSREAFLEALSKVPSVPPDPGDELPEGYEPRR
ncbi:MAG: type II toxin-antitoxin system HicB family antitoxin [Verrucomicrobia bacterium]|jgi:hypothetical protein|nr:type II toxin-antitoxin system HicB family antitoxin [Verrucomicrobiota bacterium]